MAATKVKIPDNEVLACAQYFALSNLALLDGAKAYERPNANGKYNLRQLANRGDDMLQDAEGSPSIQEEVQDWLKEAKKTMKETDYVFTEWMKVKNDYEF